MSQAQRLQNIITTALNLPVQQRDAYLNEACQDDAQLLELVKTRLDEAEQHKGAALAHDPHTLIGHSIGPYEIVSLIGVGGMGVIYEASAFNN